MFKYVGSIDRIRQLVGLSDGLLGKIAVPRGTWRKEVQLPGAQFEAEWVKVDGTDPERVILYLPAQRSMILREGWYLTVPMSLPSLTKLARLSEFWTERPRSMC